jgi:PhnB protein
MQITTYLLLDGNCKEALEFYHSVFGGELTLTTVGDSPMKAMFPPSLHARVVNARLKSALADISASDWLHPAEKPVMGNMVCFYVSGGTPEQTTTIFQQLAQGANVTDPLSDQPFGLYGALNDRFGVRWMFHAAKH